MKKKRIRLLKTKNLKKFRKKILKKQKGLCAICKKEPKIPCLDHEHRKRIKGSGLIRGVICLGCNVYIAKVENNRVRCGLNKDELPTILRNIADYLEKKQYNYLHPTEKIIKRKIITKQSYKKLIGILKKQNYKYKIYPYPKSGKLTKEMKKLYAAADLIPIFYKKPPTLKKIKRIMGDY